MSEKTVKEINLVWGDASELETKYVNQAFINHSGPEFYLIFGEAEMPLMLFNQVENLPDEITIKPKVKLALSTETMKQVVDAFNRNWESFNKKMEK